MKIAIVAPHRDDAPFALGLAVGCWLAQGHAVEVINCFTRSDHAPYSDAASLHPNDRMSFVSATLKREAESWVKQYRDPIYRGRLTLTELNLKDAPLRLHIDPQEVVGLAVNQTDKSLEKTRKALDRSRAHAFVLPLALGGHIDHLTAREAAIPSDPQGTSSGPQGTSINPQGIALAFYEDLPSALHLSNSAIAEAVRQLPLASHQALAPSFACEPAAGDPALQAAVARKRRLALCFDSQIDNETTDAIAAFCIGYQGRERLWANTHWHAAMQTAA